jgi:DNA polymerase-3 subunit gamma/tau
MADSRYLVLARKWRPQQFDDVVGQEHITRTLKNALASGRIHHAFLFIGSRGIGKTTTARVLAKALNCLAYEQPTVSPCDECDNCRSIGLGNNIDVIEIDGASNNGVDDVREIRDNIRMVPTHGRYKVYIIDEVHQLSSQAFNALLKTLEEPPPHAIFILATTEAHKIPATILSRCQRYDFRRVATPDIVRLLRKVLDAEGRQASDDALYAIARAAEGGIRDSESILDQLITYCPDEITFKDVFDVLGLVDWQVLHTLCEAILEKDVARLLTLVEDVVAGGKDLSQFVQEILRYFRNLLVAKTAGATDLLHLPPDEMEDLHRRAQQFSFTGLIRMVEQFATLTNGFDSQLAQRIALETLLIRVAKAGVELSVDMVLEKLLLLSEGGAVAAPGMAAPVRSAPEAPPNPRPAGPVDTAPTAPAPVRRITATPGNLERLWPEILEYARQDSLSLAVWLGQAVPADIEDETLVLTFSADRVQARDIVEKPENRRALDAALGAVTANLVAFRTVVTAPAAAAGPASSSGTLPSAAAVNPEEVRAALEHPTIAKIMDVFKGRIVEVRPAAAPPK